jgi:hypothetical protein
MPRWDFNLRSHCSNGRQLMRWNAWPLRLTIRRNKNHWATSNVQELTVHIRWNMPLWFRRCIWVRIQSVRSTRVHETKTKRQVVSPLKSIASPRSVTASSRRISWRPSLTGNYKRSNCAVMTGTWLWLAIRSNRNVPIRLERYRRWVSATFRNKWFVINVKAVAMLTASAPSIFHSHSRNTRNVMLHCLKWSLI